MRAVRPEFCQKTLDLKLYAPEKGRRDFNLGQAEGLEGLCIVPRRQERGAEHNLLRVIWRRCCSGCGSLQNLDPPYRLCRSLRTFLPRGVQLALICLGPSTSCLMDVARAVLAHCISAYASKASKVQPDTGCMTALSASKCAKRASMTRHQEYLRPCLQTGIHSGRYASFPEAGHVEFF